MTTNNGNRLLTGRVGVTERGDAGLDLSWFGKLDQVDFAILITKDLNEACREKIMEACNAGYRLIVHATCTGWGGTFIEPNVPNYKTQMKNIYTLIDDMGFLPRQIVLRIDPIIPTSEGLRAFSKVMTMADELLTVSNIRVRISILDEYRHVRERLKALGCPDFFYPNDRFSASEQQFAQIDALLEEFSKEYPELIFETCAEPKLKAANVMQIGCVSKRDFEVFGLPIIGGGTNPQNRGGCLCLNGKTELLENRKQCPHKCVYCYWK